MRASLPIAVLSLVLSVAALIIALRGPVSDAEINRHRELVAVYGPAGETWWDLKRDLAGGRIWMAPRYRGVRVGFMGQPVFDSSRNPILISIYGTPIWCHVDLTPGEFASLKNPGVDSFSMAVLGRVESINWYTKHVTIRSLDSHMDGGQ